MSVVINISAFIIYLSLNHDLAVQSEQIQAWTGEVITIRVENCIQLIKVGGGSYLNKATYLSVMSIVDDKNWQ